MSLADLESLSIVSKITQELENHLGITEKSLAEFILSLYQQAQGDQDEFQRALHENGAEFPAPLIHSLHRVITSMKAGSHSSSHQDDTGKQQQHQFVSDVVHDERTRQFPGLALPNEAPKPFSVDEQQPVGKDGTLASLESLEMRARKDADEDISSRRRASSRSPRDRYRSSDVGHRRSSRSRSRHRYDSRRPSRSRSRDRYDTRRPSHHKRLDDEPVVYKIYEGRVTNVRDFGAFVQLEGVAGRREGMVHVSMLDDRRVNNPNELVRRGQTVKVKVLNMVGNRISLSMKDVDQRTGEDLTPHLQEGVTESRPPPASGANAIAPGGESRGRTLVPNDVPSSRRKRMTSPELFEIKQLIAAGVMDAKDLPNFDEEEGLVHEHEADEELDVELVEDEPRFLKGQTSKSLNLSPLKVIKVPDGSLHRAAMASSSLAKERKDIRQQKEDEALSAVPRDAAEQTWQDPMANPQDRQLVADLRSALKSKEEMPEWKKKMMGAGTSFGKRTDLSIKEQRESLPIFTLRDAFVNAVHENQVLVTIGETGSGKTTVCLPL
jgi:ATP-dependent RNA helicase DHX8/PRP22